MNLSDRNDADWKNTLRKGLSFVIDTADEYQVKNIIDKIAPVEVITSDAFDAYKDHEEDNSFTIMLKTRSATASDLVQSKLKLVNYSRLQDHLHLIVAFLPLDARHSRQSVQW